MTWTKQLGVIIKVKDKPGQYQITTKANVDVKILAKELKEKAKRVIDQMLLEGKVVEYVHLGLIGKDRKSYDLLEIL